MWISAGINNMRAMQARTSANEYANRTLSLFEQDYDLELWYHGILDGELAIRDVIKCLLNAGLNKIWIQGSGTR